MEPNTKKPRTRSGRVTSATAQVNANPRVTRSVSRSAEETEKNISKASAGYCKPTQSTLQKRSQFEAAKNALIKNSLSSNCPIEKKSNGTLKKTATISQPSKKSKTNTNIKSKKDTTSTSSSFLTDSSKKSNGHSNSCNGIDKSPSLLMGEVAEKNGSFINPKIDTDCTIYVSSTSIISENFISTDINFGEKSKSNISNISSNGVETFKESEKRVLLKSGYFQYLPPEEAALFARYDKASEVERELMEKNGEVEKEEAEYAIALEHIFDHLPKPYKDFIPVVPSNGAELYLEPHHRELFFREKTSRLPLNFLDHQDFDFEVRIRLVELIGSTLSSSTWRRETFILAVNLFDSVLKKYEVGRKSLSLYALGCVQIAVKLNEKYLMTVDDLTRAADEKISKSKIESSELNLLNHLEFELAIVQPHQFLIRLNQLDSFNLPLLTMSKYLLEVSLFDKNLVAELPSKVAATCYALARSILIDSNWTPARHYYSGYSYDEITPLITILKGVLNQITSDNFMFRYYNHEKRYFVSDRVHACLCPSYYPSYTPDELNSFFYRA